MNALERRAFPDAKFTIAPELYAFHEFMMNDFPRSLDGVLSYIPGPPIGFHRRTHTPDVVHAIYWQDDWQTSIQAYIEDGKFVTRVHMPVIRLDENFSMFKAQSQVFSAQRHISQWDTGPFTLSYPGEFFPNTVSASAKRKHKEWNFDLVVHDVLSLRIHIPHITHVIDKHETKWDMHY